MLNPRTELVITVAFMVSIGLGLFFTSRIDLAFSSDLETFSGPRAYPGLLLSTMLVLFAGVAANQIRGVYKNPARRSGEQTFFSNRSGASLALFVALLVFVLTFESVGYILTMVPLLIVVALLCGAKSAIHTVITAVCLAAVCLIVFRYGLATVLPEGWFGIDAVI